MTILIGADEVGRGSYAGPVTVAAFATPLKLPSWWDYVRDSKKLREEKRESLFHQFQEYGCLYEVASLSSKDVDSRGLSDCLRYLFYFTIKNLISNNKLENYEIIIDGDNSYSLGKPVIRGDSLIKEISCASIVAKVVRDRYMIGAHQRFPVYNFAKNKGYGTLEHEKALKEHGICDEHRRSVKPIANYLNKI